jgi:uncharacterized protein (TIGR02118 family)
MIALTAFYPADASFDYDYYVSTHLPKAHALWGESIIKSTLLRGLPGPDGNPPQYQLIAIAYFRSIEEFQAMMDKHGAEIAADVRNVTDGNPTIQLSEVVA